MGLVGKWFGSRENAALYFASGLMLIAMIILGLIAWGDPSTRPDIAKVFSAVVIGALGFIGGLMSGGRRAGVPTPAR